MNEKCGLVNLDNPCRCAKKTRAFMEAGYIDPCNLQFTAHRLARVRDVAPNRLDELQALDRQHAALFRDHGFLKSNDFASELREPITRWWEKVHRALSVPLGWWQLPRPGKLTIVFTASEEVPTHDDSHSHKKHGLWRNFSQTTPMPDPTSHPRPSPRLSAWIVAIMLAMLILPATLSLQTVYSPAKIQMTSPDPTPLGYTCSLLLFLVPIGVIGFRFLPRATMQFPRKAFWWTLAILIPLGCATDFLFASRFFVFPNTGATLRIGAPALYKPVPVEEYIFYLTGFMAVLLLYLWLDEYWLAAYNVPDYRAGARRIGRLLRFHLPSVLVGLLLIAAAIVYKKAFSPVRAGFPEYFTFLVAVAFVPAAGFFSTARPFINWRAFSFTLFFILLVSLLWEATLGVPYQWWGFQPEQMLGLFIGAWAGLPIEEVCIWVAVTYTTVIVFEVVKLWKASGAPAREAFLGRTKAPKP